jgi:broad specificity phosphatase PhoE
VPTNEGAEPADTSSGPRGTRNLWLARHGERLTGDSAVPHEIADDPSLSAAGRRQAELLGARLGREPLRHVVTSPFRRTVETAVPIVAVLGIPLWVEPGVCELLCVPLVTRQPRWPDVHLDVTELRELSRGPVGSTVPQFPETLGGFGRRLLATLSAILGKLDGDVLIVTHGACIVALVRLLLRRRNVEVPTPNASLTRLVCSDGTWHMIEAGDSSHLDSPEIRSR